jgi:hypothetical protein
MQDSIVFYKSFYDAIQGLTPEIQVEAYNVIFNYAFNDVIPEEISPLVNVVFTLVKPQIDANVERRKNWKSGGRPPKEKPEDNENKNHRFSEKETNGYENEKPNVNVNDNVNCNDKENTRKKSAERIVDLYHKRCPSLPKVMKLTDARIRCINSRLKEYSEEEVEKAFDKVEQSDFLKGEKGGWKASFDWILKPANTVKILEGNYDNKKDNGFMEGLMRYVNE